MSDDRTPKSPPREEEPGGLVGLLPRLALDRRLGVFVVLLAVLVLGLVAALRIPLELFPRGFEDSFLEVSVDWRDTVPSEALERVVRPLEEELATVRGVNRMSSFAYRGGGEVYLSFKQGVDMDVAYREVRDRAERARVRMPDDVRRVRIRKEDTSGFPVMVLGMAIDSEVADVHDLIQKKILRPLERVDGVASVRSDGLAEREIVIALDREKTTAAGLHIHDIAQLLQGDGFSLASGTIRSAGRELRLRSVARFRTPQELLDRPLNATTKLSDIAQVGMVEPSRSWRVRVNGKPALALDIQKEAQANTLEVSERLRTVYAELRNDPELAGFDLKILLDQGELIEESLATLTDSGKIGAIFAVLVLFFFLRRMRMTMLITLSIPLSVVMALTAMYFAGETLNILSLLGLMICVGLLVDNSVVVAENIQRLHESGMSRRRACLEGTAEIGLAVILATLTTIVVFLPSALVDGQAQFFLMRLAFPISTALAASLLVGLLLVPLGSRFTLGRRDSEQPKGLAGAISHRVEAVLGWIFARTVEPLGRWYRRLLALFLERRLELIALTVAVLGLTVGVAFQEVETTPVSEQDERTARVQVELPDVNTLAETEQFFLGIEEVLEDLREEHSLDGYLIVHVSDWGRIRAWLGKETEITARQLSKEILDRLPEAAGVEYFSRMVDQNDDDDKEALWTLRLRGEDAELLASTVEQLQDSLVHVDGVLGASQQRRSQAPDELALVLDRSRVQEMGVNPEIVAAVVGYALRGRDLPRFRDGDVERPVRVEYAYEDRSGLPELSDFRVPTRDGSLTTLGQIMKPELRDAPSAIFRRERAMSQAVVLELEEGEEEETRERLNALTSALQLPEGVQVHAGFRSSGDDDEKALLFAAILSIVFVYLLMGFLFESFILPISVVMTIPLASIGVGWLHFFAGRDIDMLGMVGMVLLIGVVVNNGIVLIDAVQRLRRDGRTRTEAVLQAAAHRFRPILMTAATTICGMIPLALGETSSIGLSYTSFGLTLIGGLATSTVLTLLVVPVAYTLFDDATSWGRSLVGGLASMARPLRGEAGDQMMGRDREPA